MGTIEINATILDIARKIKTTHGTVTMTGTIVVSFVIHHEIDSILALTRIIANDPPEMVTTLIDKKALKIGVLPIHELAEIEIIQVTDIETHQEKDVENTNPDPEIVLDHMTVTDQVIETVITKVHETGMDQT